jgi:glutamyl-tRNA synthetase/nondiscriminating glutamyl-tRNA synthetase
MAPDSILRLRFAPSPTGQLHVGNARTALFNWLMARGAGGTFVLRIEDTDFARSTKEAEGAAVEDLRWLGLNWDEGPDAGGAHGPYRQSERLHIYRAHAVELMSRHQAYHCFCSEEQLEMDRYQALRNMQPPKYVGRCRNITADDARKRIEGGEPAVIRFRVPDVDREVAFDDLVRGRVSFMTDVIGDFVLVRSGGVPAYNFAVVIDDALMQISHVIRGEDHISNTPRQLLLYEAFGWTPPRFGHVPNVLGSDHSKLSKRHGATSIGEFQERGYLPEALANYLALLGWSPGENQELLPLGELAKRFRIEDVGKSAGVFDPEKLAWVNRHYLKLASPERLMTLTLPFLERQGWIVRGDSDRDSGFGTRDSNASEFLARAVAIAAQSVDHLDQVPARLHFLFDYSAAAALADPAIHGEATEARRVIMALAEEAAKAGPLVDKEQFRAMAARIREQTGAKGKALFHPIRLALTGEAEGLELDLAAPLIEQGAAMPPSSGIRAIFSVADRAAAFLHELEKSSANA